MISKKPLSTLNNIHNRIPMFNILKIEFVIIILIFTCLTGCINNEPELPKFYGTWIPLTDFGNKFGYFFDKDGTVYKVLKKDSEIYYTYYCTWELQRHVLVVCNQRLNYRFDDDKLYIYDLQDKKTETCFVRLN